MGAEETGMFDLTGKTALVTGAGNIGQQKCEAVFRPAVRPKINGERHV
jgi:hypothetical protein